MKLSLSTILRSPAGYSYLKTLRLFFCSTPTLTPSSDARSASLYRRITPVGNPDVSIVPVLDGWIREGRTVERSELWTIIGELTVYKRYKHALEVSYWMTDKRYIPLRTCDVAMRINLIFRVHGLKPVEDYFSNVPKQFKQFDVYVALLNCYAHEKLVDKAEAIMQKLHDMGYALPLGYNVMMNLYYHMGNWEKLDPLMREMEDKGIYCDRYTLTIRLSAYSAASDAEGVDKIVTRMESDPRITLDYNTYVAAAQSYLNVGMVDKAFSMLSKLERLMLSTNRRNIIFDHLLRLYAKAGKKDEVFRIWNLYKAREKIFNKGYIRMMNSLMEFNDLESAEKIFKEWESSGLSFDFRVPNFLIDAYCKADLLGEAEALLSKGISKEGKPRVDTWYHLAGAYIVDNQIPKAVEALSNAILVCPPYWRPNKDTLRTCLEYLEGQGDVEKGEEFIELLKVEGLFSAVVHDKLHHLIKGGKSQS